MQSLNFEFLRTIEPNLAETAALAEHHAYVDPSSAAVKLRNFAEEVVERVFAVRRLPYPSNASLIGLLGEPTFKALTPAAVINQLNDLRTTGNRGAHGKPVDSQEVIERLRDALSVGRWVFVTLHAGDPTATTQLFQEPSAETSRGEPREQETRSLDKLQQWNEQADESMKNWRDRYTYVRLLGEGGQAQVFEVRDNSGTSFALKQPIDPTDGDAKARATREIEVQSSIRHPNVMPLVDFSQTDGWLVMPVARQFLRESDEPNDSSLGRIINDLNDAELLNVVKQVIAGLTAAHTKGFTHRDIKPSNVLLLEDDTPRWVVADWGIVRRPQGSTTVLRTVTGVGTGRFAAPEQWNLGHAADFRSDYYSVGRLVAAARSTTPLMQGVPSIPSGTWRQFVREMTAVDPNSRPQQVDGVLRLIEQVEVVLRERTEADSLVASTSLRQLLRNPRDKNAARILLTEAPTSQDANTVLLDDVPTLPKEAFATLCQVGSDDELRALAKAIEEQPWERRDFDHANAVLDAFVQLLDACAHENRWDALEDVAEVYAEMCANWDRYRHRNTARNWLERLPKEAQGVMARVLKRNVGALKWFADGNWRPSAQATRLLPVFGEVLDQETEDS